MKHNRHTFAAAALCALGALFTGICTTTFTHTALADGSKEPLQIVTTIFPEYDWVRQILGERSEDIELTMLLDSGVDLHSYQPTVQDMVTISTCDLFIYVGGESDEWVEDALAEATNPDMQVIDLLESLGELVREEETVEGMQAEEEENEEADEEDEDEIEYDEHVWLSLRNAQILCGKIAEVLGTIDPDYADLYAGNAASYIEQLDALDQEYQEAVEAGSTDILLFGDRFPFRYLTDDYGLTYYAAFSGCSAETEASFETIVFLAEKVDELDLHAIMTIEGEDHKVAETIRQATVSKDQQILTLDSMQSATAKTVEEGATYLGIMEDNLQILREALR